MLIDWFTVGAQFVNFAVLVWLLRRFLYKPVLDAIAAREKGVADTLADAQTQMTAARKAGDDMHAKSKAFDEERGALLGKAVSDAHVEAERLVGNARRAADALTLQRDAALKSEAKQLSDKLSRLAASEGINIARTVLEDLAGADLESRMGEIFARRLRGMDSKTKELFGVLLTGPAAKPVVASTFELSPPARLVIQTALNETFAADIHLTFEASSGAISGIELSAGGQCLSWTFADHLKTLEQKVTDLLGSDNVSVGSTELAAA